MADPVSRFRTNYFHVTDEHAFLKLMRVAGYTKENGRLWPERDSNGKTIYAFGSTTGSLSDCTNTAVILFAEHGCQDDFPIQEDNEDWSQYDMRLSSWCEAHDVDFDTCEYAEPDETSGSFIGQLQELLPEDDCIVVIETGYQKLQYLWGEASIITKNNIQYTSLEHTVREILAKTMGPDFHTRLDS